MARKKDIKLGVSTFITLMIILLFLTSYFIFGIRDNITKAINPYPTFKFREDVSIELKQEDFNLLKEKYLKDENEYLFCLKGSKIENKFTITNIEEQELEIAEERRAKSKGEEIVCSIEEGYLGSLHKHPKLNFFTRFWYSTRNYFPSNQDIYTFGTMRNQIHIVQFNEDKFYASEYLSDEFLEFKAIKVNIN